jgi:hypothetical protein
LHEKWPGGIEIVSIRAQFGASFMAINQNRNGLKVRALDLFGRRRLPRTESSSSSLPESESLIFLDFVDDALRVSETSSAPAQSSSLNGCSFALELLKLLL